MNQDFEERQKKFAEADSKLLMEVLFGAEPCKKECKKESPPNLCYGKCCGTCKEGSRGYEFDIYCEKYEKWIEVEQVCDDWEEVV